MINKESMLKIADNSGGKKMLCFGIPGGTKKKYAGLGDIIVGSVRGAYPNGNVKNKEVVRGVVVRTRKETGRKDGSYVRFSDNAVVLINKDNKPRGTRVFGPIAREVKDRKFDKIASLAPEIH